MEYMVENSGPIAALIVTLLALAGRGIIRLFQWHTDFSGTNYKRVAEDRDRCYGCLDEKREECEKITRKYANVCAQAKLWRVEARIRQAEGMRLAQVYSFTWPYSDLSDDVYTGKSED